MYKKTLINMFRSEGKCMVFFEVAKGLYRYPHMRLECIPLPNDDGTTAPIYFKVSVSLQKFVLQWEKFN